MNESGVWVDIPPAAVGGPTRFSLGLEGGLPAYEGFPPLTGYIVGASDAGSGIPLASFGYPVTLGIAVASFDLDGAATPDLRIAHLDAAAWVLLPTTVSGGNVVAQIAGPGTYAVVEFYTAGPNDGQASQTSDAPAAGLHRVDPGALVTIDVHGHASKRLRNVRLVEQFPVDWGVVDAGGGIVDAASGTIAWSYPTMPAGATASHRVVLRAPMSAPDGRPAFDSTIQAALFHRGGASQMAPISVLVAPPVVVGHATLAQVDGSTHQAAYLPVDAPIPAEPRYAVFRLRYQVRNADSVAVAWTPLLEFRMRGTDNWTIVPAGDPKGGVPFYASREWVPIPGGIGTKLGGTREPIVAGDLKSHDTDDSRQQPVAGIHSMSENPLGDATLDGETYTEIEFSVRATVDAEYLASYEFRVTDAGRELPNAHIAALSMGARPPVLLSPGQRLGLFVGSASPALPSIPASQPSLRYPLNPTPVVDPAAVISNGPDAGVAYPLAAPAALGKTAPTLPLAGTTFTSPHIAYGLTSDTCAACHNAHEAQDTHLLANQEAQAALCLSCHDGSNAETNVKAQYDDSAVPADDPATASIYRHPALAPSTHTNAGENEFQDANGQPILNRHSDCSDCHQPHRATSGQSTQTASGWTLTGAEVGISGVSVVNGIAGSSPAYTFLDGSAGAPTTYEYQLCFKCHSGFTQLLARQPGAPSEWSVDKGIELNPANDSYHPIEAPGKNATSAMDASLAGTSSYKLWRFSPTSTIRCENCHADQSAIDWPDPPSPPASPPAAGADLPVHASRNRGLLLQNYRDRTLKGATDDYDAYDFALCYICHAEAPFVTTTGDSTSDTNFSYHGFHVSGTNMHGEGLGGTSIDIPGAGGGDAICAECHFRPHSTASENDFRSGTLQTGTHGGLVVFAPDVQPNDGVLSWTRTGENSGSCTLTCHGYPHLNAAYGPTPAPSP